LYHRTAFSSLARRTIQPSISHRAKSSSAASGRLINSDIPHKIVTLVQPDGKLASDSVRLASLLREIDQSAQFIELVSERPNPIVRIRDKKEAREQEKLLKERRTSSRTVLKEIKVSWVISNGDLDHKVTQMRQNLSKGYRVSVLFTAKPGQMPPPAAECDKVIDRVVDALKDVATLQRLIREGRGITSHTTAYFIGRDKGAQAHHNKMASEGRVQDIS